MATEATGENLVTVENRGTSSAPFNRAAKPNAFTSVVARSPLQEDGIILFGPFLVRLLSPINQNNSVTFGNDVYICYGLTVPRPPPIEGPTHLQQTVPLQSPYVEFEIIDGLRLG